MKSFIIKLIALFLFFQITLFAEATKEETISFIKQKLDKYGTDVYFAGESKQSKIKLSCDLSGVCRFEQWLLQRGYSKKSKMEITYHLREFNLKDFDVNQIEGSNYPHDSIIYYFMLRCKEEKKGCVRTLDGHIDGSRERFDKSNYDNLQFYINYKLQAKKVEKAFIHLIQLYAKKELF